MLCSATLASLLADRAFNPANMFTRNKTTRIDRIDPNPTYSFLPIVICKNPPPTVPTLDARSSSPRESFFPLVVLVVRSSKVKLDHLRRFFWCRHEFPFLHRVLARLDQQWVPPDRARALHVP